MLQGLQLQLLLENTRDRLTGVPGLTRDTLIPIETPGLEQVIVRDLQRVVATVEKDVKVSLYPKRKTNLPKTVREAYENKLKYERMGVFTNPRSLLFPTWDDLTTEQREFYLDPTDPTKNFYANGTINWDIMTKEQKRYLTNTIIHVPNKSGDEEKLDGKNRSHIRLYNRDILKIHKISLEIKNPQDSNMPLMSRTYGEGEYYLYKRMGEIVLSPMFTQMSMAFGGGVNATNYGLNIPSLPQVVCVDYSYGMEEIPLDLMNALAMYIACKVFENVNMLYTHGLMSYSVQGFSASFGKGMYTDIMDRYKLEADTIVSRYRTAVITAQ